MHEQNDFDQRIQGIEALIRKLDTATDPATRSIARELLQSVMDLHGAGLRRVLELIFEKGDAGQSIIDAIGDDRLAGSLLLLYGLHPLDLETRVRRALDRASLKVHSHGGSLEFVGISDGAVMLKLHGISERAAAVAVKAAIDAEIYAVAPDVVSIRGLESFTGPDFFPLAQLAAAAPVGTGR